MIGPGGAGGEGGSVGLPGDPGAGGGADEESPDAGGPGQGYPGYPGSQGGQQQGPGGGYPGFQGGGGQGGSVGLPGFGRGGSSPRQSQKPRGSRIDITRYDEFVTIVVTVADDTDSFFETHVTPYVSQMRGQMDMQSGQFRLGDYGQSLKLLLDSRQGVFPQGALPRPLDASRGPRPWPASQRVSWLREILPYLGDDRWLDLHGAIDPTKSWRDPKNLRAGSVLVPQFLHPRSGHFYVKMPGINQYLAATHFVGMAGVGPDAPYYDKSDPRAGIFGFDRQTTVADIRDGVSNTIFVIQTDPNMAGPWIAGGGATVRGTSEQGDRDVGIPGRFVSPSHGGQDGVLVMMADGTVRFLSKGISPEVFRSLCTMAGNDTDAIGDLDAVAPRVNLPRRVIRAPSQPASPPASTTGAKGQKPPSKGEPEEEEEEEEEGL